MKNVFVICKVRKGVGGGREEGDETTASFPFGAPSRRLTKNMLNYCFLPTCLVPSRATALSLK